MAATKLVRAEALKLHDVIPVLEDRVTFVKTIRDEVTVVTFDGPAGTRFVEVTPRQLIRIAVQ